MIIIEEDRKSFSEWMNNDKKNNHVGCAIFFFIFGFFPVVLLIAITHGSPHTNSDHIVPISIACFLAIFLYILVRNKPKK